MTQTTKMTNRLANEKSPYLYQHSDNPVNWYPWGEEAFSKAKMEDKPIFLSIGYSTCHWCHVMAHESFEDADVADFLNKEFISIKVDREERPDIDAIYMATCQAFTGQGGWPLTIFMTPEQKPFYAGTYFPKHSRYNIPGFMDIIKSIAETWIQNKQELIHSGNKATKILQESISFNNEGDLSEDIITKALDIFYRSFDSKYGGFGVPPKFPSPHNLMFLLRCYSILEEEKALEITEKTLVQMYKGGIFDHVGFGFSRYSTDEKWLVPHFEKMLYDNALLAITYLETYQITGKDFYKTVAVKILAYVLSELTSPDGGFYSAQDADSDCVEGKYYVFSPDEIIKILGEDDGKYFNNYYDITTGGNFEGKSIPNLIHNSEYDKVDDRINKLSKKIYEYRKNRTHLHKDDKSLTSWNSLMIVAFSKAYKILKDPEYLTAATSAFSFIETKLTSPDGMLYIRYRDNETFGDGLLDDYAFYIWALIELYEATFESKYLEKSILLSKNLIKHFWDNKNGGFYLNGNNSEKLIFRPKELYDGAIPSGNSVASYTLLKLARMTGNVELEEIAYKLIKFIAGNISDYPAGYSFSMISFLFALYPSREIVCVPKNEADMQKIREVLSEIFLPSTTVLVKHNDNSPFTKDYEIKNNQTTFYVCEKGTCSNPFNGIENFQACLKGKYYE